MSCHFIKKTKYFCYFKTVSLKMRFFTLQPDYNTIFELFQLYFTSRIWPPVQLLLIGAILTPGQRPSNLYYQAQGRDHHTLLEWAEWMLRQVPAGCPTAFW
jgi:hypothetical protein